MIGSTDVCFCDQCLDRAFAIESTLGNWCLHGIGCDERNYTHPEQSLGGTMDPLELGSARITVGADVYLERGAQAIPGVTFVSVPSDSAVCDFTNVPRDLVNLALRYKFNTMRRTDERSVLCT